MDKLPQHQYYVPWLETYDLENIKAALRKHLGRNGGDIQRIRTANQYGWSNQPQVVVFSSIYQLSHVLTYVQPSVDKAFGPYAPTIRKKDW